jgi:hypothetical protein
MRDWLQLHLDDFMATMFVAVIVAALVGFIRRSTGAAVFVSCSSSATLVLIAYPWISDLGFDWKRVVPGLGVVSGLCAVALFKIAMSFADRLGKRDTEIADSQINKGLSLVPGKDKP